MPSLSRRDLLRLTALAAPALATGCGPAPFDAEAVPESVERFPRTPMAGDVTADRAVIAFHVADDAPVTLRVWTEEGVVLDEAVAPSGDGFHKVFVDGLASGADHAYAVFHGEAPDFDSRSLIGRFRTAPAAGEQPPITLALVGCVGQGTVLPDFYFPPGSDNPTVEPFRWELFTRAAGLPLDGLVHLGDQAYLDFVWANANGTLEAYLQAWGFYHGGGYRDLYPLAALFATWDDHESTDNARFDPWDLSPEDAEKLSHAQAAWYKAIPIDAERPEDRPVWRSFRFGDTVELVLLDCRYELTPDRLMGEAQLAWLVERIGQSPCRFVCVATPKPFSAIATSVPLSDDNADRWEGAPEDRARVEAAIDALSRPNVIFVCGDIHMNYLGRTSLAGERPSGRCWEVCVTSGNVNPRASGLSPDQFAFVDTAPHLPVLTFDPEAGTVHVAFHAADGSITFERTLEDV